ncbi:hypothetical protein E4U22_001623, partial [Claviceps purpurea]
MTLIMVKNNDANALYQRVRELERQIQTKDGELQKGTDRALQQAEEIRGIVTRPCTYHSTRRIPFGLETLHPEILD